MRRRTLAISVSEPGFGAWAIGNSGWIGADDEESGRRCVVTLGLPDRGV